MISLLVAAKSGQSNEYTQPFTTRLHLLLFLVFEGFNLKSKENLYYKNRRRNKSPYVTNKGQILSGWDLVLFL